MDTFVPRSNIDRRSPPPFFSLRAFGTSGRRVNVRRVGDRAYVDHYEWPVVMIAIGIVIMSAMDAAFTLRLLSKGAIELNAVMAILIESDVQKFVAFKLGLTITGVLLLVIHKNVQLSLGFTVYRIKQAVFLGYVALISYELWLFHLVAS